MSSVLQLLNQIAMGCVCSGEVLEVEGIRYSVKTRLGEGGFSYVDLVEDRLRKLYAMKRITCHSRDDEKIAMREVEYMRMLDHPNLVPLVGSACVPLHSGPRSAISEVYIVMPYFRRGTLWNELEIMSKQGDHMQERRILKIFLNICKALKALHDHFPEAIAHRDMKPHNVLLTADDVPVLMDFGSMAPARVSLSNSSQAQRLQDEAAERCSMPYRAPELFHVESHSNVDERVDIWSLGCTLYAMCYKESPFDQAYQRGDSIALAVLAGNIRFPQNDVYSQGVKELILSMLVINPAERPFIDAIISQASTISPLDDINMV